MGALAGLVPAALVSGALAPVAPAVGRTAAVCTPHWVGTWEAPPSDAAVAPAALHDQTLRMIVSPHLGGTRVRIHLSNRFGSGPVVLGPVTVAVSAGGARLSDGSVRAVTFDRGRTVRIATGSEVLSDPVPLRIKAFQKLVVNVFVPGTVTAPTEHAVTAQMSYVSDPGSGDVTGRGAQGFAPSTNGFGVFGWYFLNTVDVEAPGSAGSVVAFGDSITDGFPGVGDALTELPAAIDQDERYPDDLQRRIDAARLPLAVLDGGVSGNRLLQGGHGGLARFHADAIRRAGISDVITLEGVNDILQTPGITASKLIDGYHRLIAAAHRAGVRIQLGTLTPIGGELTALGAPGEPLRRAVNAWIRTQRLSDGIVDFDAALRDPHSPGDMRAADAGDPVHPNVAGYHAMASAVALRRLALPRCTAPARH